MIDIHTHTFYSHDGSVKPENMAKAALDLGLTYVAFTDHCDRDCLFVPEQAYLRQLDTDKCAEGVLKVKQEYQGRLYVALGIELGYSIEASPLYEKIICAQPYDVILNSVHLVNGKDPYYPSFFAGRSKSQTYGEYLESVLESVDAGFDYDVIAHIGYCARKAPYRDKSFRYAEFPELFDSIFKAIIRRGKCLEINTNVSHDFELCLPTLELAARYRALGGELITFASDAHVESRIGEGYSEVTRFVKELGFPGYTIYKQRKAILSKFQ